MSKAPAFQLYVNDWLSSPRIALMTPAEEGAYIRLLCYAWNDPDCSLPDDDEVLAQLSRLGEGWFKGASSTIRKCFDPHPEKSDRLVNLRLLEERHKRQAWLEKSRVGGMNSGKSRALNAKGGSSTPEPRNVTLVQRSLNSSSSFSSSTEEYICPTSPYSEPKAPSKTRRRKPGAALTAPQQIRFYRFWAIYPRKEAKKSAMGWWAEHDPDDALLSNMLSTLERAKKTNWSNIDVKYIPLPRTWLNEERWADEITIAINHTETALVCQNNIVPSGSRTFKKCSKPVSSEQLGKAQPLCDQCLSAVAAARNGHLMKVGPL